MMLRIVKYYLEVVQVRCIIASCSLHNLHINHACVDHPLARLRGWCGEHWGSFPKLLVLIWPRHISQPEMKVMAF